MLMVNSSVRRYVMFFGTDNYKTSLRDFATLVNAGATGAPLQRARLLAEVL